MKLSNPLYINMSEKEEAAIKNSEFFYDWKASKIAYLELVTKYHNQTITATEAQYLSELCEWLNNYESFYLNRKQ